MQRVTVIPIFMLLSCLFICSSCGGGGSSSGDDTTPTPAPTGPSVANVFFASGLDGAGQPVGVSTSFTTATALVYSFATWQNMTDGVVCESVWLLDGAEAARDSFEWSLGQSGTDWLATISGEGGLPAGQYRWELYINGVLLVSGGFSVV